MRHGRSISTESFKFILNAVHYCDFAFCELRILRPPLAVAASVEAVETADFFISRLVDCDGRLCGTAKFSLLSFEDIITGGGIAVVEMVGALSDPSTDAALCKGL